LSAHALGFTVSKYVRSDEAEDGGGGICVSFCAQNRLNPDLFYYYFFLILIVFFATYGE